MKNIRYSPAARDKLVALKRGLRTRYGDKTAANTISCITETIKLLQMDPYLGASAASVLGIPSEYRFLHIGQNYVFYKVKDDAVLVVQIYNEQENFMQKLFGIELRTQESIEFWGE